MPELPEVETVRRGLQPYMEGWQIERLDLRRPDLRFPFPERFAERLGGRQVTSLGRRAKYLVLALDDGNTAIAHLGMSGSFRIEAETASDTPGDFHHPRSKDGKHDHVVFHMRRDQAVARIIYNDPRRFGFMDYLEGRDLSLYPAFAALGPEPTGNALDDAWLAARLAGRRQPLKSLLLDQSVIAGLGNIYVCEALWRAGLSPLRTGDSLVAGSLAPPPALSALNAAIHAVIADAIAAGGSSLRDHIRTDGSLGYFQHSFAVYDREGAPCPRPGCGGTVARTVQAGRSTFHCETCQH